MKKVLYLIVFLIGISTLSFGQSQRLVLAEEATNASCGPCASQNPAFDALLLNNLDKVVAIKYHWYFPGYDPMHNHNVEENNARVAYYSINGVPHALLDGVSLTGSSYTGAPANCNQSKIDAAYAVPSPFEMEMSHEVIDGVIYVTMLIKATEEVSGNMFARIAVIEKLIHFASPPGGNGETDFHDVMKKMLPNTAGNQLPSTMYPGEYIIIQESWELANVYDMDELGAVGFIQDNGNKEVHQAARSSETPIAPLFSNDVEINNVSNFSFYNCDGQIQPVIKIRNNGSTNLSSLEISYNINGGDPIVHNWTGDLAFLESDVITLDDATFSVMDMNTLQINLNNPNGQTDEYTQNNVYEAEIERALLGETPMLLYMILDDNPGETTWEVTNYEGEVIHEGGPYTTSTTILEQLEFTGTNCYTFTIYDAGGDGLSQGGSVAFGYGSTYLLSEVDFGSKAETQFRIEFTDVPEIDKEELYSVFPNPAIDNTTISLALTENTNINYSLYSMAGKAVVEENLGLVNSGDKTINIDLSGMDAGIYYLNLNVGGNTFTEKLVLTK